MCRIKSSYLILSIVGVIFLVACAVVFITYLILVCVLMLQQRNFPRLQGKEAARSPTKRRHRNTLICLLLGCSFVVCVLPFGMGAVDEELNKSFASPLLTLNHIFNPLVYFVKYFADRRRRKRRTPSYRDSSKRQRLETGTSQG